MSPGAENFLPADSALGQRFGLLSRGRLWTVYAGQLIPPHADFRSKSVCSTSAVLIKQRDQSLDIAHTYRYGSPSHSAVSHSAHSSDSAEISEDTPPTSVLSSPRRETVEVVFKYASPATHRDQPKDELDIGEYNPGEALAAILAEAKLYSRELVALQGVGVPHFFGLFECDGTWIMVLARVEHALPVDRPWSDLLPLQK